MMRLIARLKNTLFPKAPLSYEKIRATYSATDDDTETLESGRDVEPDPEESFIDKAKQAAKTSEERYFNKMRVEEREKLERLSAQLEKFANSLEEAVIYDAKGEGALGFPSGAVRLLLEQEDGSPETFIQGYENDLVNTPGYKILGEKCKKLRLTIDFETDYDDVWEEQDSLKREMGISFLAPTIVHVEVVITGWK